MNEKDLKVKINDIAEKLSDELYERAHDEVHNLGCHEEEIGIYFEKILMQTTLEIIAFTFDHRRHGEEIELLDLRDRMVDYFSKNMDHMIKNITEDKNE
jgi:hypothetical protein